ncbi:hypothetical protein [Streptomyces sp. NPDC056672]|uniref:hypothetical protein n=1 Tax=Streptomyces sp. NPDC056672 TaxID=3345906 RepID=UPI0036ABD5AF
MTKTGSDSITAQAREIARTTRRRFPDVLTELRSEHRRNPAPRPPRTPSKELVPLCRGFAHPIDGGRCAQPGGHPGHWTWCGPEPHFAAYVWMGYYEARDAAEHAEHEAWLASLTPEQRAEYEAESAAAYQQEMADAMRDDGDDTWRDRYAMAEDYDEEPEDPLDLPGDPYIDHYEDTW